MKYKSSVVDIDALLARFADAHALQRIPTLISTLLTPHSTNTRPAIKAHGNSRIQVVVKALTIRVSKVTLILKYTVYHLCQLVERYAMESEVTIYLLILHHLRQIFLVNIEELLTAGILRLVSTHMHLEDLSKETCHILVVGTLEDEVLQTGDHTLLSQGREVVDVR